MVNALNKMENIRKSAEEKEEEEKRRNRNRRRGRESGG